jgi:hypothetical protein
MKSVEIPAHVGDVKNYDISSKFSENLILLPTEKNSVVTVLAAMGI